MPLVTMERVETFSSAHRLHSHKLSDEENKTVYGKCNNTNGHGHNYVWRVILKGELDQTTGMVFDLAELKKCMAIVLDTIDHRNIDKDIAYFKNVPSTSENVCIYLWEELKKHLRQPNILYKCVVEETPKNIFSYKGK
ncbi:unnamed protein product [Auanema sp. JU1783]|nr:unnamed protein product [Auanema sp. JU1783]